MSLEAEKMYSDLFFVRKFWLPVFSKVKLASIARWLAEASRSGCMVRVPALPSGVAGSSPSRDNLLSLIHI